MHRTPRQPSAGGGLPKDLIAASAVPLLLAILAEGDSYGYAIIKRVRDASGGRIEWSEGMLYPVLHRLADGGHVQPYWQEAVNGRKRKYYRITPVGARELERRRKEWGIVNTAIEELGGTDNGL
jgi:PadR family transcriptional regulator